MDIRIIVAVIFVLLMFGGTISKFVSDTISSTEYRITSGNPTIGDILKKSTDYDGKSITTEGFRTNFARDMDKMKLFLKDITTDKYMEVVAPYGDSVFDVVESTSCKLSTPVFRVTGTFHVTWSGGASQYITHTEINPTLIEFVRCQEIKYAWG